MCGRSLTMLTLFGRWVPPQGRHPPVGGLGQPVVHVVSEEACVLSEWSGNSVMLIPPTRLINMTILSADRRGSAQKASHSSI